MYEKAIKQNVNTNPKIKDAQIEGNMSYGFYNRTTFRDEIFFKEGLQVLVLSKSLNGVQREQGL